MALTDLINGNMSRARRWFNGAIFAGMIALGGYTAQGCSLSVIYPPEDAYQTDKTQEDSRDDIYVGDGQAEIGYECLDGKTKFYQDKDKDTFGNPNASKMFCDLEEANAAGYVANKLDIDDTDPNSYMGAPERCDEIDNNGDGNTDEGLKTIVCASDKDKDGYGDGDNKIETCKTVCPDGSLLYQENNKDCNDNNNEIYPTATELCDLVDSDCDGNLNNSVVKYEACGLNGNGKQEYP